jgi:ACR3 family arsenite transporter
MGVFGEKQDGLVSEIHSDETSRPASDLEEAPSTPDREFDVEKASQQQSTLQISDSTQPRRHRQYSNLQTPTDDAHQPDESVPPLKGLSFLDRFLVLWILLAMALGIILGNTVPSVEPALHHGTFVGVSVPIAVGLLVMMYPILCKVRFETLHLLLRSKELWRQIGISFVLNWILAPLLMTGLAWAFLPDRQGLRDGLIFVGVARCIAMVLIWTDLAGGDGDYCAVLVAFNSILQIVLFAPMATFYVQVVSRDPWTDIDGDGKSDSLYRESAGSVAVFLGIPLAAAVLTRLSLHRLLGEYRYQHYFIRWIAPWSLIGLLYTIVVLFASQGIHVVEQITSVLRVCAPLVVYFLTIFPFTAWMMWRAGFGYRTSCTQSFTAASNNFELAIAVVVAVYGAGSEEALAATVGPLIEVPVLVGLVYVIQWCRKRWNWKD